MRAKVAKKLRSIARSATVGAKERELKWHTFRGVDSTGEPCTHARLQNATGTTRSVYRALKTAHRRRLARAAQPSAPVRTQVTKEAGKLSNWLRMYGKGALERIARTGAR